VDGDVLDHVMAPLADAVAANQLGLTADALDSIRSAQKGIPALDDALRVAACTQRVAALLGH
jgi:hypothetical protein